MKTYFTILLMSISLSGMSQLSAINIVSEAGDNFTVFANGTKVNPQPMSTVIIPNRAPGKLHVRFAFVKKGIPELNSQVSIPVDGQTHYMSFKIVRNSKGPYSLVFIGDQTPSGTSSAAAKNSPNANSNEKVNGASKTNANEKSNDKSNDKKENSANNNANTGGSGSLSMTVSDNDEKVEMTISQSSTQTPDKASSQKNENSTPESVTMSVNTSVNEKGASKQNTAQQSVTYETTGSVNQSVNTKNNTSYSQNTVTTATTTTTNNNQSINMQLAPSSSYSSSVCSPMADADFQEALDAADEPIDENVKMSVAKGVFDDACLNTTQIYRIAELFINEDRRLEFAKFAYSRASDKSKYFRMNKLFIDEGRITDLTNYVRQQK